MKRVIHQIGADRPEVTRYTGKGVCVAVLDSGIVSHPDLSGRILDFQDFTRKSKQSVYLYNYKRGRNTKDLMDRGYYDDYGHGTHVCGIIGGSGAASQGTIRGVAPDCSFLIGKVLDHKGAGRIEDLCRGIEWVLEVKDTYSVKILNISIGVEESLQDEKKEILQKYLKKAWEEGILVVVSDGNNGPKAMTISDIGDCSQIITVGCHDGNYRSETGRNCGDYSSRGPGTDVIRKPDLVAPGTDIVSCNARFYYAFGKIKDAYVQKSGTSMSAPIVAGAAALLLEKKQTLSNSDIKRILLHSAQNLKIPWNAQGYGMLHLERAMRF